MKKKIRVKTIDAAENLVVITNTVADNVFLQQGSHIVDGKSTIGIFSLNLLLPMWIISDDTEGILERNNYIKELEEKL